MGLLMNIFFLSLFMFMFDLDVDVIELLGLMLLNNLYIRLYTLDTEYRTTNGTEY